MTAADAVDGTVLSDDGDKGREKYGDSVGRAGDACARVGGAFDAGLCCLGGDSAETAASIAARVDDSATRVPFIEGLSACPAALVASAWVIR